MKIGYIRTSTIDQNLDRQKQIMKDYKVDLLYSEQESGKDTNRPVLNEMLNSIRPNDEVIITSLDRLSRNYKDLKGIIQIIKYKRQAYLFITLKISLTNPLLFFIFHYFSFMQKHTERIALYYFHFRVILTSLLFH